MFSPLTRNLIESLRALPGVGPKSAQRLAFHLLAEQGKIKGTNLANALQLAINRVSRCQLCRNYTEHTICGLCQNHKRNHSLLCVVENPADAAAIEQTHNYFGLYFVLQGHLSPLDGIGPEQIGVPDLLERVRNGNFDEIIIATNSTVEGRATAHYIANHLQSTKIRCSRIAHGVPLGGEIEYLDSGTLRHAFSARIVLE